jgi:hypothetical protein
VPALTVLSDETRTVEAEVGDGRALVPAADLSAALGWELKPEGLCRDDVCVPVRDPDAIRAGDRIDVVAVAAALDRPALLDEEDAVLAVGEPRALRRQAKEGLTAPDLELPDLDGERHRLEEWRGRKKLLTAFASW